MHVMGTKSIVRVLLTVVQGHPVPSPMLSKTQSKQGRCQSQGQSQGSAVPAQLWLLPSPFKFNSGEWEVESIFISGLLPADCDSSVHALCKLNLTSTVLLRASFSFFYSCFLL